MSRAGPRRGRTVGLLGGAALAVAAAAALVRRVAPFRVAVAGRSMEPALWDGDLLVAVRPPSPPRLGDVVVVADPRTEGFELVKRVVAAPEALAPDGRRLGPREVWVEGDRRGESTDSRALGPLDLDAVLGLVVLRYWPPGRAGPVR